MDDFKHHSREKKKNIGKRPNVYTKLYKLDGIPMYNCDAVKEFTEQRID